MWPYLWCQRLSVGIVAEISAWCSLLVTSSLYSPLALTPIATVLYQSNRSFTMQWFLNNSTFRFWSVMVDTEMKFFFIPGTYTTLQMWRTIQFGNVTGIFLYPLIWWARSSPRYMLAPFCFSLKLVYHFLLHVICIDALESTNHASESSVSTNKATLNNQT